MADTGEPTSLRALRAAAAADGKRLGEEMMAFIAPLYPICRSITGAGVRETLRQVQARLPLELTEVPTGTPVLDWTVPREWNVRDAWVADASGRRVIDFRASNLHLVSYSAPVRARMSLAELRPHLHSLPDRPQWIPYRTSYYKEDWGFCLSHDQLGRLAEGEYEVVVDSTLADGSLTYGECVLGGASADEVLVSCHVCHPSLANDNLSGLAVAVELARALVRVERRYTYRFLFIPGTIGSITWLASHPEARQRVRHGLVAAGLGDPGPMVYKKSRRGDAEIDRAAIHVLSAAGAPHQVQEFVPFGYDERQYGSPGFDLPVGSLTRTPYHTYPQYHTSADDLSFIRAEALADSWARYLDVIAVLEGNRVYRNLRPDGEPQLGRRGLYRSLGGSEEGRSRELALLWVLNQSDGQHALLDIAERAGMPFATLREAADALIAAGLLAEVAA